MSKEAKHFYEFGEFRVDPDKRLLLRDNQPVPLPPKAFETLLVLVQRSEKVVLKDDLMKALWPDSFVEDSNLTQHIFVLRKTLGETAGENRYIATIPGKGYQFAEKVRLVSEPEEIVVESQSVTRVVIEEQSLPERVRPAYAWVWIGVAAVAVVALLGGGWYWRSHRAPKLTEKDTIVVADFENRTGDPVFDGTLKEAMAVDLDQSPYLNIVSDPKISEALKLMGRDAGLPITGEAARDLCQRVNGNAMLQGSIANFGKQYVVVLTTTNCATGDSLGAEQFRVESKEKILPALDRAAASLRARLGESLGSIERYAMPVEQASTPSLAALQAYSEGLKALDAKGNLAAIPFFKRATELDPNFAMAHAYLGQASSDAGVAGPPYEDTTKAFGLRDRTSDRERFYIDSSYYDVVTGEFEKEVQVLEQWRQVYPREARPARILAHLYRYLGRYEESLREARDSVRLEPDADSNYDQLVLSALMLKRLDEAQAALQARDPDSYRKAANQYRLAFLRNDLAGMQRQEVRIAGKEGEGLLLSLQSDTEAYHGRLRKAREFTRRATE